MAREKSNPIEGDEENILAELAHPIYLDTPMLVSFLAAVDDDVWLSSEVAQRAADSRKASGDVAGAAKLPSLASLLGLTLSVSGKYAGEKGEDQSTENKFVRQHTAASLFNRLRMRLKQRGILKEIETDSFLPQLAPGDLVVASGRIEISPLERLIQVFNDILPFIDQSSDSPKKPIQVSRERRRSMTPAQLEEVDAVQRQQEAAAQQQQGLAEAKKIVGLIERDFQSSPVTDLILRQNDLSIIITASRDFFSVDVSAAPLGGTFTVLGKISAVDVK